jgi:hypothetical protein
MNTPNIFLKLTFTPLKIALVIIIPITANPHFFPSHTKHHQCFFPIYIKHTYYLINACKSLYN